MQEITVYNRDMFVFVDKTGSDRRDSLRRYSYSLRGKPARSQKLLVRGKRGFQQLKHSLHLKVKVSVTPCRVSVF